MRLGRSLFGSLSGRNKRKNKKPGVIQTVGAIAAAAVLIKVLFDKYGDRLTSGSSEEEPQKLAGYEPPVKSGKKVELDPPSSSKLQEEIKREREKAEQFVNDDYVMTELGKLALCWYMSAADGGVCIEEKAEIDQLTSDIRRDPNIPQKYKDMITREIFAPDIKFSTVTRYLDHADAHTLLDLVDEIEALIGINGVSYREQKAVDEFKQYVEQRTGRVFAKNEAKPSVYACPNCGAQMTVNDDRSKAICEFCGSIRELMH